MVNDIIGIVGVQAYPLHAVENDLHGFGGGALQIGVFDAQQEFAAVVLGKRPGIQRGAHAADVQVARGAGGETGFNGHDVGFRNEIDSGLASFRHQAKQRRGKTLSESAIEKGRIVADWAGFGECGG